MVTMNAQKMTRQQFFAASPANHPGFLACDDPALGGKQGKSSPLFMPNLVALIKRMGGLDAIPGGTKDGGFRGITDLDIALRDGEEYSAMLKDKDSGQVHARLCSLGCNSLVVDHWHPHVSFLELIFGIPADWSAAPWQ